MSKDNESFYGFEEEEDIEITFQQTKYVENILEYSNEKLYNEISDLIRLDVSSFDNIKHYNTYIAKFVDEVRNVFKNPYIRLTDSAYPFITKHIYPLVDVNPVKMIHTDETDEDMSDDTFESQFEFLKQRQFIVLNSDSFSIIELRSMKHFVPYTLPLNVDPSWITLAETDHDCYIVNQNNELGTKVRVIGPTFWYNNEGKINTYYGDELVLRGFAFLNNEEEKEIYEIFKIDDYLNNIVSLNEGQAIHVYFNSGKVIDGNTRHDITGIVTKKHDHMLEISLDKTNEILYYCTTDLTVNSCFIYSKQYNGIIYHKRLLFNKNWLFLIEDEKMNSDYLYKIIFPSFSEGIHLFPYMDHIRNLHDLSMINIDLHGIETFNALKRYLGTRLQSTTKNRNLSKNKKDVDYLYNRISINIKNNGLMFKKNSKLINKWYSSYLLKKSIIDGEESRYNFLNCNKHYLHGYFLDLYKRSFKYNTIDPISLPFKKKSSPYRKEAFNLANTAQYNANNLLHLTLLYNKINVNDKVYVISEQMCYTKTSSGWSIDKEDDGYLSIPSTQYAIKVEDFDVELYNKLLDETQLLTQYYNEHIDEYKLATINDIKTFTLLGNSYNIKKKNNEMKYTAKSNEKILEYDYDNQEEIKITPENLDQAYVFETVESVNNDDSLDDLLHDPIGNIFMLLIELIGIDIDVDQIKIILYNIVKNNDYQKVKNAINEKEIALNKQVQMMMKNKNVSKDKLDELISKRLNDVSKTVKSEFYCECIFQILANIVLHIQTNLPSILIKNMYIPSCNVEFSYGGYPYDNNSKSLIKYLSCVIKKTVNEGHDSANPLSISRYALNNVNVESKIQLYISKIIEVKPHYNIRLSKARKRVEENQTNNKNNESIFDNFKPSKYFLDVKFPIRDEKLLSGRYINSCCINNVSNVSNSVEINNNQDAYIDSENFNILKEVNQDVFPNFNKLITHSNVNLFENSFKTNDSYNNIDLKSFIYAIINKNSYFQNDKYLLYLLDNNLDETSWNMLSSHVTIKWQEMIKLLNVNYDLQKSLFQLFVKQDTYDNAISLKRSFEKVVRTLIPSTLAKSIHNYTGDNRYLDTKTYIDSNKRSIIASNMIDKETMELKNIIMYDSNSSLELSIKNILSGIFNIPELISLADDRSNHKIILLYNFIILKTTYLLVHSATKVHIPEAESFDTNIISDNQSNAINRQRIMKMLGFVSMLLKRIFNYVDINYIQTEKVLVQYEQQRENTNKELMTKISNLSNTDRNMFNMMKDKIGIDITYIEKMKNQLNALVEIMKSEKESDENYENGKDAENVSMDWVGEDPDEIEIDDDGSGY